MIYSGKGRKLLGEKMDLAGEMGEAKRKKKKKSQHRLCLKGEFCLVFFWGGERLRHRQTKMGQRWEVLAGFDL